MPVGRELKRVIERELEDQGVTDYSFGHTGHHSCVTWVLNGQTKQFPFPAKSPDQRALKNIRSEVRRFCRHMKQGLSVKR